MKKLFKLLSSVALAGLLASAAHAADAQATEAKVIKVAGSATVTLPGQSAAVALSEGMSLPAGSVITTGAGSEVDLQPMAGAVTAIRANSSVVIDELSVNKNDAGVVTKQTAQISLKSGNVVSTLDPANKSINNYGVRTPKGVAAARGTVYGVGVNVADGTESVATLAGTVTLTTASGVSYTVDIGTGIILGVNGVSTGGTQTLASMVAAEGSGGGEITDAIAAAVETVSASVASGATSGDAAVSILAAVVNVASQANPTAAASFTSTAVAAVASPTASLGSAGATTAAAAVTEAAVQGAVQTLVAGGNTAAAQAVTNQITQAATSAAVGTSINTSTVVSAAATGAATGTAAANAATGGNATAPTVTTTTTTGTTTTEVVVPPTTTTPITPVDPTVVVSPSSGQQ